MRKAILAQGAEVVGGTPEAFGKVIADDTKYWAELLASMPKMTP